ncbi:MAG: hypothetical protein DWP92_00550, partial [Armatimonadetes bacterium]
DRLFKYEEGDYNGTTFESTPTVETDEMEFDGVGSIRKHIGLGSGTWHTNDVDDTSAYDDTFDNVPVERDERGNTSHIGANYFAYDVLGHLVGTIDPIPLPQGPTFEARDAFDRRCYRQDAGGFIFVHEGERVIQEIKLGPGGVGNTVEVEYFHGAGVDKLVDQRIDGTLYGMHVDHLGTPYAATDGNGDVAEFYSTEPFGKVTIQAPDSGGDPGTELSTSAIGNQIGFAGMWFDPETNLYYARARHYSPFLRRFMSRDPLGVWGDVISRGNPYAYVWNAVTRLIDPTGLGAVDSVLDFLLPESEFEQRTGVSLSASERIGEAIFNGAASVGEVLAPYEEQIQEGAQTTAGLLNGGLISLTGQDASGVLNSLGVDTNGSTFKTAENIGEYVETAAEVATGGKVVVSATKAVIKNPGSIKSVVTKVLGFTDDAAKKQGSCFPSGTEVSTSDGTRPIEEVKVGDVVSGFDLETGKVVQRQVTRAYEGFTYVWVDIHFGQETVTATRKHRFWVVSSQEWIAALNLKPGMYLRTESGNIAVIERVGLRELEVPEATFNLEVLDVHNFFVGRSEVLVHNGDVDEKAAGTSRAARREAMRRQDIPTSQQPSGQSKTQSGRQYRYDTPAPGGGSRTKVVTQHPVDPNHGPHWESGVEKPPADYGTDSEGRSRHFNNDPETGKPKTRVTYPGC